MWAPRRRETDRDGQPDGFCEALWGRYIKTANEAGRDVKPGDAAAWGGC